MEKSNQQTKSLFIVSSAIHANHGVFDKNERLNQTIETCKSIRQRVSDCDIFILDGGTKDLSDEEKDKLQPYINDFYSYADSENVKEIQKSKNWDIVKNLIEIMIFGNFFEENKNELRKNYKRIFKVSGRYVLNDNFDYDMHMNARGKIVVRGLYTSQFPSSVTRNLNLQYMSRLWSFDSSFIFFIAEMYKEMYKHMIDALNSGGYVDIEHLLCFYLDPQHTCIVNKIGIEGQIAPNGTGVSD